MLEKYQPSFYGKDVIEQQNTWNTLLSTDNFARLISEHKQEFAEYIINLRKAEIFEQCPHATIELNRLKTFVSWKEFYTVNYNVYTSLSFPCETIEEFVAHVSGANNISSDWVVSEFREAYGGDSLEWELSNYSKSDLVPGEISVYCLSLLSESMEESVHDAISVN